MKNKQQQMRKRNGKQEVDTENRIMKVISTLNYQIGSNNICKQVLMTFD